MIVVVGGQARKVGKTRAMCDIIAATRELEWTAVKLTSHPHDAALSGPLTDTQRYLDAGAATAVLARAPSEFPRANNLIVESNAIVDLVTPDLFVFVADPTNPDWKTSARHCFARADVVVERVLDPPVLRDIVARLLAQRRSAREGL